MYSKIVNIGQEHVFKASDKKRIALLNTYVLVWMHLSCFFIFLDVIFKPKNQIKDISIHAVSLAILSSLIFLNYKNKFNISRGIYLLLSFVVYYVLSFIIAFSPYTICYFVFLPLVVMSLYESNRLAYVFLVLCLLTYNFSDFWLKGFSNLTPEWQLRNLLLIKDPVVTSLFFAGFFLFHYFKKLNIKNEQKLEASKETELASLQLKFLKAQMNPHFMFNAVNSIQSLVLQENKHEAYMYLSKFSGMIRENLNRSENSFIRIKEEVQQLDTYLALEKLRFREQFVYSVIADGVEAELEIPSMILQPFVESAIKNSLLHKADGIKELHITIKQLDTLECIITDNGIGYEKFIKKEEEESQDSSFSKKIVKERLKILREFYHTDVIFAYQKVKNGTSVVVNIPYNKK